MSGELSASGDRVCKTCKVASCDGHSDTERAQNLLAPTDRRLCDCVQELPLDTLEDREILDEENQLGTPGKKLTTNRQHHVKEAGATYSEEPSDGRS